MLALAESSTGKTSPTAKMNFCSKVWTLMLALEESNYKKKLYQTAEANVDSTNGLWKPLLIIA